MEKEKHIPTNSSPLIYDIFIETSKKKYILVESYVFKIETIEDPENDIESPTGNYIDVLQVKIIF